MEVVGEAEDGTTAVRLARKLKTNVVVMDLDMPGIDNIKAIKQIKTNNSNTKVVALATYLREDFIKEMLKAGVSAYVLKEYSFSMLVQAIRTVMADEVYLCPKVARIIVDSYTQDYAASKPTGTILTDREREVLAILAEGKNTKQIALKLKISTKTVHTHRRNIMCKLELESLPELTKYAIRCGLTSVE